MLVFARGNEVQEVDGLTPGVHDLCVGDCSWLTIAVQCYKDLSFAGVFVDRVSISLENSAFCWSREIADIESSCYSEVIEVVGRDFNKGVLFKHRSLCFSTTRALQNLSMELLGKIL